MTSTFVPYRDPNDRRLRIRMTVEFPLLADDIAQVLASAHREKAPDELPLLRYTDAVHVIRTELIERGGKAPFRWRTAVERTAGTAQADALEKWAREEVRRNFPALSPSN
ncbi:MULTISPECIES: hypothetical protein [Streptomyces]|uniref:Uncharacterized protein n=1 Tax=Streptomyces zinciresistens K42 TaxID=700597 RepID=G2GEX1_9ACTN|nr:MULTISPECIES: hypothetical protein [Streptomyces]EGX57912.1 hypothetical protein SZN_20272 [Streptomyces zinciresistens K42]MDT9700183.1 hypothetical protein [Streptomyces sp. P17]